MNEHVDSLNTIEKLEDDGFEGVDACLMVSLFEYGLAWKLEGDEILFIYAIHAGDSGDYDRFDRCTLDANLDPKKEWDWVKWYELAETYDLDLDELPPLEMLVFDIIGYYGFENVFGASYWEGFAIAGDDKHDNT